MRCWAEVGLGRGAEWSLRFFSRPPSVAAYSHMRMVGGSCSFDMVVRVCCVSGWGYAACRTEARNGGGGELTLGRCLPRR